MKRYLLLLVPVFAQAALAWAEGPAPRTDAERGRQLHANIDLIRSLVNGGLDLAAQDDPLKRARACKAVAEAFAGQISEAAARRDGARTYELGHHFHYLLESGFAPAMSRARREIQEGSAEERTLTEVRDQTAQLAGSLEEQLQRVVAEEPQADIQRALRVIQGSRLPVEQSIKGPGKPKDKVRGKAQTSGSLSARAPGR